MVKEGTLHAKGQLPWQYRVTPDSKEMIVWKEGIEPGHLGHVDNPMPYKFKQIVENYAANPKTWKYMYEPIEEFLLFEVTVNTN